MSLVASSDFYFNKNPEGFLTFLHFAKLCDLKSNPSKLNESLELEKRLMSLGEDTFNQLNSIYTGDFFSSQLSRLNYKKIVHLAFGGKEKFENLPVLKVQDIRRYWIKNSDFLAPFTRIVDTYQQTKLVIKLEEDYLQCLDMGSLSKSQGFWQTYINNTIMESSFIDFCMPAEEKDEESRNIPLKFNELAQSVEKIKTKKIEVLKLLEVTSLPTPLKSIIGHFCEEMTLFNEIC